MKYCKRFTEGLGYFVCFLILIFIAYSYITFNKSLTVEEYDEAQTVFTYARGFREYLIMFGMFFVTAVICSLTDKLPFIGMVVSAVPVYYVFKINYDDLLVFCPKIIMILTLFFFAGEVIATVQWAKDRYRRANNPG